MQLSTNKQGFRGEELRDATHGTIVFLGDSFTMGYGVDDHETFPALVHRQLQQTSSSRPNVINAGMGDNGNGRWIRFLREVAPQHDPHLVVLQVYANDIADNQREKLYRLNEKNMLETITVPAPGLRRQVQRLVETIPGLSYSRILGLLRQTLASRGRRTGGDATRSIDELTRKLITTSVGESQQRQWPVIALLAGLPPQLETQYLQLFQSLQIDTVIVPDKQSHPELYYEIDGHWNAAGHREAAARLMPLIRAHLSESRH
ncbi:MAG: SGNH/GDSL hydrolase family protein [bacterium]